MRVIELETIGSVTVRKSIRAKRVIIKIDHKNQPVVVIPKYIPYSVGVNFAKQNIDWISEHTKNKPVQIFTNSMNIGKKHQLFFNATSKDKISSRVQDGRITINIPIDSIATDKNVQAEALKAATRAIKSEAEELLPSILHSLAKKYGYEYSSCSVKNMRSRWGSCSSEKVINLNIWLMQLPLELIEYVCCHELAHLNHPNHQASFWQEVKSMIPDYVERRKMLKSRSPSLSI